MLVSSAEGGANAMGHFYHAMIHLEHSRNKSPIRVASVLHGHSGTIRDSQEFPVISREVSGTVMQHES